MCARRPPAIQVERAFALHRPTRELGPVPIFASCLKEPEVMRLKFVGVHDFSPPRSSVSRKVRRRLRYVLFHGNILFAGYVLDFFSSHAGVAGLRL